MKSHTVRHEWAVEIEAREKRRVARKSARMFCTTAVSLTLAFAAMSVSAQSANPFGKPSADVPFPSENIDSYRFTRPIGWKDQTRSEVLARHGIAATSQPSSTAAALEILQNGGNAIDAAVAAAAVQTVTEQNSVGLGADLFAIVWSERHKKLFGLMASGWAPAAWNLEYFRSRGFTEEIPDGIHSAVVPGGVSGWFALLDRFGSKHPKEVFEPAWRLAHWGYPVHERMANSFPDEWEDPDSAALYQPGGVSPPIYSNFKNPGLAKAFKILQTEGRDGFYKGKIAQAMVRKSQSLGGAMTLEDLAEYESEWVEPVSTNYHGYDIHQLPPPTQGWAALEMLNILEVCVPKLGMNLAELGHKDPMYWHLMIEAKKLAYSDLLAYNADPKFNEVPLNQLLSKQYAEDRLCQLIDPDQARPAEITGNLGPGTVYLATADRWGNMVSLVNSVFSGFGSKVTIPEYGFQFANRGQGFVLTEGHPNVPEGRKRPFITIIAAFITQNGKPLMAFGNMGGGTQPQAHVQHVVNMVDLGMNVQATTDVARFDHSQGADRTALDEYLYEAVGPALMAKGHNIVSANGHAGGYQGIYFERNNNLQPVGRNNNQSPVHGVYRAGSDPRKDGHAAGW